MNSIEIRVQQLEGLIRQQQMSSGHRHEGIVNAKTLQPRIFGARKDEWKEWSSEMRNIFEFHYPGLRDRMLHAEGAMEPISDETVVATYGLSAEAERDMRFLLVSKTTGEARKIVEGATAEAPIEVWRQLAQRYDGQSVDTLFADKQLYYTPTPCSSLDTVADAIQEWESLEARLIRCTRLQPQDDEFRLLSLLKMLPASVRPQFEQVRPMHSTYDKMKNT